MDLRIPEGLKVGEVLSATGTASAAGVCRFEIKKLDKIHLLPLTEGLKIIIFGFKVNAIKLVA